MFLFSVSVVYAYPSDFTDDSKQGAYVIGQQIAQAPAYNIQVRPAPPPPPRQEPAYNIQVRPAPPPALRR